MSQTTDVTTIKFVSAHSVDLKHHLTLPEAADLAHKWQTHCYNPVAPAYPICIMRMDDNADAKRILLAFPPADWKRQLGRPRITWLSTVQQDLKQHHLTLPEAADLAQNPPLWRMMSTYGATQS